MLARAYRYRSTQHIQAFATLTVCPLPNSINHNRFNPSDQTWTTRHWNIFLVIFNSFTPSVAPTRPQASRDPSMTTTAFPPKCTSSMTSFPAPASSFVRTVISLFLPISTPCVKEIVAPSVALFLRVR